MAKKYGKKINLIDKLNKRPSTQVSGTPFKSISNVNRLFSAVTLKGKGYRRGVPTTPRGGKWFEGSSSTAGKTVTEASEFKLDNTNPFYNYLIENSIARTITPVLGGSMISLKIITTGVDSLVKKGDTFYIYNPRTFRYKKLTADQDLNSGDTSIRFTSTTFTRGEYYPTNSYIIADNKQQIKKVNEGVLYKKFTLSNAEYKTLYTSPYTLLTGESNYIHMPITCYIQYIHGADEMTRADLYIGHDSGTTTIGEYWGSVNEAFYRHRNAVLLQIGASTYSAGSSGNYIGTVYKSSSDDARADDLTLYTTADYTSASSYIIVHLWYQTIYTN